MSAKGKLWILGAVTAFLLTSCTGVAPHLLLELEEVDLGEVVNGEVRLLEVPLQNAGDAALVVEAVTTACGCTTADVEPTTLGPGAAGALRVSFDSGAHGAEANGPMMRQVFIASNDPDQPEVEFRIRATVIPPET